MENKIYLSTNMRDERNVIEWVIYHLIIGFDKILIVDNNSEIPIKTLIKEYNLSNYVDVIEYSINGAIKIDILNNYVKPYMLINQVDWFIHLDADEYLNLNNNYQNVKDLLNIFNKNDTNMIAINWLNFGSNFHDVCPEGLLIENYIKCDTDCYVMGAGYPVKCFVNPYEITYTEHPHYWFMTNNNKGKSARNLNWKIGPYNDNFNGMLEPVYINHYAVQSYEEYMRRKINRVRDDYGNSRPKMEKDIFHSLGNRIDNTLLKDKYAALIKKYMHNLKNSTGKIIFTDMHAEISKTQNNRNMYLELLKKCLVDSIYTHWAVNIYGNACHIATEEEINEGTHWPQKAHTMIGIKRLDNIRYCIEKCLEDNIIGDFIETGVWRGGSTIYMKGILKAHNILDRKVYVADSFNGYPNDCDNILHTMNYLKVSEEEVINNFKTYNLLDDNVIFIKGFFETSLKNVKFDKLAVLRLDSDMYSSTIQVLEQLYDKVSIGGFIIVDDFTSSICSSAITDFRNSRNITDSIFPIGKIHGAYWRKTKN